VRPGTHEPDDRRSELALELADLDDRLETLDDEGPPLLWLVVPVAAALALSAAAPIALGVLGPYLLAACGAGTIGAFSAIMLRGRSRARAERAALEKERSLIASRLGSAGGEVPPGSSSGQPR